MLIKPKKHKLVRIDPKFGRTLISNDNSKLLNSDGSITKDTLIGYIILLDNGTYKVGQLLEDADNSKQFGKLPETVWQDSYLSVVRGLGSGVELKHLFIFSKSEWKVLKKDLLIDNAIRNIIRKKHKHPSKSKKIPFSANLYQGHTTDEFRNKENLQMYEHNNPVHFEILKNICKKDLMGIDVDSVDAVEFVEMIYQKGDTSEIIALLKKYQKVLLSAYTSYGKTLISTAVGLRQVDSQGGGLIIVTTPRVDTLGDFTTNPVKWDFGTKKKPIVIQQKDIKKWPIRLLQKKIAQGYVIMLLASIQGVRSKSQGLDEKSFSHEKFKRIKKYFDVCALWIRDEKWTEYGGPKTAKLVKQLEEKIMILDLAATTSKIRDDYDAEAIVDRSLFWAMQNRKLTQVPNFKIDGIYYPGLTVIDKLSDVFTEEENWNPRTLFVDNDSHTDFANRSIVETLPDYFYRENALAKKMGISIVDDKQLPDISKRVGLWVLPQGTSDWPAEMYLPKLSQIYNTRYKDTLFISAYELEKKVADYETTNDCIKDLLNTHERIVILTHRKYTVGSSIDHIGHIVLFDNIGSDDLFEQLLGRLLRLIKEQGNNIKTMVKIKAMVPNLQLKSTLAKMVVEHSDKTESNIQAKEFFDQLGLTAYDISGKPVDVKGSDVMDEIAKQRLAVAGSGLKPTEVQDYLSDSSVIKSWQNATLPKMKFNGHSLKITDHNGSKNGKSKGLKSSQKSNNYSAEQIRKIMNEGFALAKTISYLESNNE